jgi:hypothetical protein
MFAVTVAYKTNFLKKYLTSRVLELLSITTSSTVTVGGCVIWSSVIKET